MAEKTPAMSGAITIKMLPQLRARLNGCAEMEGLTPGEYVRAAIVAHCTLTERLHLRRKRAHKDTAGKTAGPSNFMTPKGSG